MEQRHRHPVLALVPSVAVFFAAQKHFVDGVASTGLKG